MFAILFAFDIPAIVISLLILVYSLTHSTECLKLQNHVWLVLLIVNFLQLTVDLPMAMSFFYLSRVWPAYNSYCLWWTWYEYSLNNTGLLPMAWASVERHFHIFHPRFFAGSRRKKWSYHFLPISMCCLWTPLWYLTFIILSPICINIWRFDLLICGAPCYVYANGEIWTLCTFLFNVAIPLGTIILSNTTLIIRIIYGKIVPQQAIHWRRQRTMALQLCFISLLYLASWLPATLFLSILSTLSPSLTHDRFTLTLFHLYWIPLLLPVVYLNVFPEIRKKLRQTIRKPPRNRIRAL